MIPIELSRYIESQKDNLDLILAEAARSYVNKYSGFENFAYDMAQSEAEAIQLSGNDDLCYDRLSTPVSYSLWYQGKRINAFLSYLSELLYQSRNENSIRLFDLGAGTGAVQCACAVVLSGIKSLGYATPKVTIVNVDTSPLMLQYHNKHIRPLVEKYYGISLLKCEYHVNSWDSVDSGSHTNNWIVASYLFDHSENLVDIRKNFYSLVQKFEPNKLILITAGRKRKYLQAIAGELSDLFRPIQLPEHGLYSGSLINVQEVRTEISQKYALNMSRAPRWKDPSNWVHTLALESFSPSTGLSFEGESQINLFNPPFILRKDVKLNEKQLLAAKHKDNQPVVISGPAGCGKSLVISERVKNIVLDYRNSGRIKELNILITTFNKQLEHNIRNWIEELFSVNNIPYSRKGTVTEVEGIVNGTGFIHFLHFDVLPTRIGKLRGNINFSRGLIHFLQQIIDQAKSMDTYKDYIGDICMNPEFLLDEYERVWYGLEVESKEHYLGISRKGRGHLPLGKVQRKIVASLLSHFEKEMKRCGISSFYLMRKNFLQLIKKGTASNIYSHIVVDEFQDCTQADYSIFYGLLKENNNLILAGDMAQSVQIGSSSDIPRQDNSDGERMNNRKSHLLEGSYRLPCRISECVKPLSQFIISTTNPAGSEMNSFKGAPPGARPILVYANDTATMADKISAIIDVYDVYDIIDTTKQPPDRVSILEKDFDLQRELLSRKNNVAETDTILKIKGLEKRCVVWSTRINVEKKEELVNFVYTILTRTSSILIIAVFPEMDSDVIDMVKKLKKNRLIFWDDSSHKYYNEL
jgi:hypothetical protein